MWPGGIKKEENVADVMQFNKRQYNKLQYFSEALKVSQYCFTDF